MLCRACTRRAIGTLIRAKTRVRTTETSPRSARADPRLIPCARRRSRRCRYQSKARSAALQSQVSASPQVEGQSSTEPTRVWKTRSPALAIRIGRPRKGDARKGSTGCLQSDLGQGSLSPARSDPGSRPYPQKHGGTNRRNHKVENEREDADDKHDNDA